MVIRSNFRLGSKFAQHFKLGANSDISIYLENTKMYPLTKSITPATITCSSLVYNGSKQIAQITSVTLDGDALIEGTDYIISINEGGTDVGTYNVTIQGIGDYVDTSTGSFNITVATGTANVSGVSLTYNGNSRDLITVTGNTGTMHYRVGENGTWSTTIPTATDTGSWIIYYYMDATHNYTARGSSSNPWGNVSSSIGKADQEAPTAYGSTVTYGNTANASASGGGGQGSIEWSNGSSRSEVGSQSTYARWSGNNNYNASPWSSTAAVLTVNKASQSAPTASGATTTYPTTATASASGGGGYGTIEWESAQSQTSTGSHTTRARWSGNGNYNASPWSGYVTVQMNKANQSAPTAYGATVDYGYTASASASGGGGQGSIEWSNGSARSSIGSQSTSARWSGNSNYNASSWSNSVTLTVNNSHTGHDFVDLGLPSGTKWATMNVGASSITDYGNYYLWGYGNTVYSQGQAALDDPWGNRNLTDEEDTARKVWGGLWHMPTRDQVRELINISNTTDSVVTINGVNMFKITSKRNSNYVLFPYPGTYHTDGTLQNDDYAGDYWTRTPDGTSNSYVLEVIRLATTSTCYSTPKNEGLSVRPVIG